MEADGSRDPDTIVWWLQTGQLFADIRLPADRSAFAGATRYADLDAAALALLARQEGFAGILEWTDAACAWRRMIDFRPLPGPPDEGWMEERAPGRMIERGLHTPYLEEWEQTLPDHAVSDEWIWHHGWTGRTVLKLGDTFMTAEDRRPRAPDPENFASDILAAKGDEAALAALLDCEISVGKVGPDGVWRITLSTIPWRAGEVVSPA